MSEILQHSVNLLVADKLCREYPAYTHEEVLAMDPDRVKLLQDIVEAVSHERHSEVTPD